MNMLSIIIIVQEYIHSSYRKQVMVTLCIVDVIVFIKMHLSTVQYLLVYNMLQARYAEIP